jgi:starvation-inducible DNA-binding protein
MKGGEMGSNGNNGHHQKQQALIQPNIGISYQNQQAVLKILNVTLADESVLSIKTRGAHWNVNGMGFYDWHSFFDLQYKQLVDISDEISKRACVLGGLPIGSFNEFLSNTRLKEQPGDVPDVLHLLADHESLIRYIRDDLRKCSEEYEDEGTFELLVSIMRQHEKIAWLLRSYLENSSVYGASQKRITNDE